MEDFCCTSSTGSFIIRLDQPNADYSRIRWKALRQSSEIAASTSTNSSTSLRPHPLASQVSECLFRISLVLLHNEMQNSHAHRQSGTKGKSGLAQIRDNANQIRREADPAPNPVAVALGFGGCLRSTNSLNGNNRPLKSIKWQLPDGSYKKRDFMAYHVTWVAENGRIPNPTLNFSHRCHDGLCVAPMHGLWEDLPTNSARNACMGNSHLVLPNGAIVRLCPHEPSCLSGPVLASWDDPAIVVPPIAQQFTPNL